MGCAIGQGEASQNVIVEILVCMRSNTKMLMFDRPSSVRTSIPLYESAVFFRSNRDFFFLPQAIASTYSDSYSPYKKAVFRLKIQDDSVQLSGFHLNQSPNSRRVLFAECSREGQRVEQGSVVRVGGVHLRVAKISLQLKQRKNQEKVGSKRKELQISDNDIQVEEDIQRKCRVCGRLDEVKDNPIVFCCNCSPRYVHLRCYSSLLLKNFELTKSSNVTTLKKVRDKCSKCNLAFEESVKANGKVLNVSLYNQTSSPYIQLHQLSDVIRVRHFIDLSKGSAITVGTEKSSLILSPLQFVSKSHCQFLVKNKQLFVKDLGSQYGTLIRVDKLKLPDNQAMVLVFDKYKVRVRRSNGATKLVDSKQILKKSGSGTPYALKFLRKVDEDVFEEKNESDLSIHQELEI